MKKNNFFILFLIPLMFFIGCGGTSSSSSSSNKKGIVIDDIVVGVKYLHENGETGYTNEKGEFFYSKGNTKFYVGDMKVGEINTLPDDGYVFIQDMLGLSRDNTSDDELVKVATLLQSLDSDLNTDIIEIKRADLKKFETGSKKDIKSMSLKQIEDDLKKKKIKVRNKEEVKLHLRNSQKKYNNEVLKDKIKPSLKSSKKSTRVDFRVKCGN